MQRWSACPRSTASSRCPTGSAIAVGDRIRIVPNHVCSVSNLGRQFYGLRGRGRGGDHPDRGVGRGPLIVRRMTSPRPTSTGRPRSIANRPPSRTASMPRGGRRRRGVGRCHPRPSPDRTRRGPRCDPERSGHGPSSRGCLRATRSSGGPPSRDRDVGAPEPIARGSGRTSRTRGDGPVRSATSRPAGPSRSRSLDRRGSRRRRPRSMSVMIIVVAPWSATSVSKTTVRGSRPVSAAASAKDRPSRSANDRSATAAIWIDAGPPRRLEVVGPAGQSASDVGDDARPDLRRSEAL